MTQIFKNIQFDKHWTIYFKSLIYRLWCCISFSAKPDSVFSRQVSNSNLAKSQKSAPKSKQIPGDRVSTWMPLWSFQLSGQFIFKLKSKCSPKQPRFHFQNQKAMSRTVLLFYNKIFRPVSTSVRKLCLHRSKYCVNWQAGGQWMKCMNYKMAI